MLVALDEAVLIVAMGREERQVIRRAEEVAWRPPSLSLLVPAELEVGSFMARKAPPDVH